MKTTKDSRISLRMTPQKRETLEHYAAQETRSLSNLIMIILDEWLEGKDSVKQKRSNKSKKMVNGEQ